MLATAGKRRTFVRIEKPVAGGFIRGEAEWELHEHSWVEVQASLPSRSEQTSGGSVVATWRARVRTQDIPGMTSRMRMVDVDHGRIMQIVAGPAELDQGGLEFMVEEYKPAGNAA